MVDCLGKKMDGWTKRECCLWKKIEMVGMIGLGMKIEMVVG